MQGQYIWVWGGEQDMTLTFISYSLNGFLFHKQPNIPLCLSLYEKLTHLSLSRYRHMRSLNKLGLQFCKNGSYGAWQKGELGGGWYVVGLGGLSDQTHEKLEQARAAVLQERELRSVAEG